MWYYSLINKYNDFKNPIPGPFDDDHNFNNVNDVNSPWTKTKDSGELIEKLAWYSDTTWFKISIFSMAGTDPIQMKLGFKRWLRDSDLQNHYRFKIYFRPSFSLICDQVQNNHGVILDIAFYNPEMKFLPFKFGHYVSVAGVNINGGIAFSDPYFDKDFPLPEEEDWTYHNNPSIVSHDHYIVSNDSPCRLFSNWWLTEYGNGALIFCAVVISQIK